MGRYRFVVAGLLAVLFAGPAVAAPTLVTMFFDPADFYDFAPLEPGQNPSFPDMNGGMFKLHEIYNDTTPPEEQLHSWVADERPNLDEWARSLSPDDPTVGPEGIGFFNINLTHTTEGDVWGQALQTPLALTRLFTPAAGWTGDLRPTDMDAGWTASGPASFIRPDTTDYGDGMSFGFQFATSETIPAGSEQTIWFGGYNYTTFDPSLTFSRWDNGFPSRDGAPGTGFEATLRLRVARVDALTADFNQDRVVDGTDFLTWQTGFGTTFGATHEGGDANFDGVVDGSDFLLWQAQFGLSAPGGGGSAAGGAVPEPASVALAGVVLLCGFGVFSRFRPRAGA